MRMELLTLTKMKLLNSRALKKFANKRTSPCRWYISKETKTKQFKVHCHVEQEKERRINLVGQKRRLNISINRTRNQSMDIAMSSRGC